MSNMPIKIEAVTPKVTLGESPFWDADTQTLYFVDVFENYINKYTPATNSYAKAFVQVNGCIASIIPIDGRQNEFIIAAGKELIRIKWDGVSDQTERLETFAQLPNVEPHCRFNDARVDYSGQLWIGYISVDTSTGGFNVIENASGLFSMKPDRTLTEYIGGLTMSNGLDWNKKQNKFYYVNTFPGEVLEYDYNPNTREFSNKRICFTFDDNNVEGAPDGMAIDENDNLWIACFHGGKIVNINPRVPNTVIRTIDMPIKGSTSVAFGGPNLDELYVTTPGIAPMEGNKPTGGGYVYKITGLGVRGFAGRKLKLH